MGYEKSSIHTMIREDLERTRGHLDPVKAGFMEKLRPKKVKLTELHVNPDDEFCSPDIGPNDAIMENYCKIALRQYGLGLNVFDEPLSVNKLRSGGYLILNGHHRWAGAVRARVPTIRIKILDP